MRSGVSQMTDEPMSRSRLGRGTTGGSITPSFNDLGRGRGDAECIGVSHLYECLRQDGVRERRAGALAFARTEPHGWHAMTTTEATSPARPALPTGPRAAEVWDEICRGMGIKRLSPEEAAARPPRTEEQAAAFERAVAEVGGEAVDELTGRWPAPP